jgi:thymidylate synthase
MDVNFIRAGSINDAWRDVMQLCILRGWDYVVEHGSYEGQIRRQLETVMIELHRPWSRPLAPFLPAGIPAPTSDNKIDRYFCQKLMSSERDKNETYTYGQFIEPQLQHIVNLLALSKGNTNQATIRIGDMTTDRSPDPPCLRSISFKVVNGRLNMALYFRSWDLYAGLPENLGGLQLLKEYVLGELQDFIPVQDGKIFAYSDGLHLYEQYFDLANSLNVEKIRISDEAAWAKLEYIKEHGV